MPNISERGSTKNNRLLIEDMARLLVPWGVPQTAARLYGYLLLCPAPASLDEIVADLEMSKSSASVAARLLEKYALAHRNGERGSKRALYTASENYEGILGEQKRLLKAMSDLLKTAARAASSGGARKRLETMAAFYTVTFEAMDTAVQKWRARRSKQA